MTSSTSLPSTAARQTASWFGRKEENPKALCSSPTSDSLVRSGTVVLVGYFDTATRKYTLFSPPEVARYEISAILVEPERVWIALDHFGEDISTSPGGLVRWNR